MKSEDQIREADKRDQILSGRFYSDCLLRFISSVYFSFLGMYFIGYQSVIREVAT